MEDDYAFGVYLDVNTAGDLTKNQYLKSNSSNTSETWDEMTRMEKYVYMQSYSKPHWRMFSLKIESKEDLINELRTDKSLLKDIEGGDKVYDALVDLYSWIWDYWQVTGTVYDFYNYYDGENAGQLTEAEQAKLTQKSEEEEIAEIREELMSEMSEEEKAEITGEEPKKESTILKLVKRNWFTLVILSGVGIAFLVIRSKNRKKNLSDGADS